MGEIATTNPLRWHGPELSRAAGALDPATAEKAAKGDDSVVGAVDRFLANPAATALWGDMGRLVLRQWVRRYAGKCVTTERAVLLHAADLRDRLAGQAPNALITLLAERVVLGWVAASYFENVYSVQPDTLSVVAHRFHAARIEAANRTLMNACRTLAKVQRRKLPDVLAVVQVNTLPDQRT